jgi:hypothetical protein
LCETILLLNTAHLMFTCQIFTFIVSVLENLIKTIVHYMVHIQNVESQNVERQNVEYQNVDSNKTSTLQNVDTTKRRHYKMSTLQNVDSAKMHHKL